MKSNISEASILHHVRALQSQTEQTDKQYPQGVSYIIPQVNLLPSHKYSFYWDINTGIHIIVWLPLGKPLIIDARHKNLAIL